MVKSSKADNFLVGDVNQLQPLAFMEASQKAKVPVTFRPAACQLLVVEKTQ